MKVLENAGALAETLLRMVGSRLELFGLELRQERTHAVWAIGLICLASGSFLLAGVGVFVLLAITLPPDDRAAVMVACISVLALVCVVSSVFFARLLLASKMPFRETREVLNKDAQCLTSALKKKKSQR